MVSNIEPLPPGTGGKMQWLDLSAGAGGITWSLEKVGSHGHLSENCLDLLNFFGVARLAQRISSGAVYRHLKIAGRVA
jgi:hypothetical protein